MHKLFFTISILILFVFQIQAQQIPLNPVVEHFTNTRCSICKNRNPGFYNNLSGQKDITHLSIHPSSPYSACILSKQNTNTNDARTNYYGIYGGTPRLVINGSVISTSANYNDVALFNPFKNLLSSFEVKINLKQSNTDSLNYEIQIKKVAESNLITASLFSGLAEDTVFVDGGNGESEHYNVLRHGMQESIGLPAAIGNTITITKSVYIKNIWNSKRLFALAMIQESSNKNMIQSGKSATLSQISSSIQEINGINKIHVYPNPTSDFIYTKDTETYKYVLLNLLGESIQSGEFSSNNAISIAEHPNGLYFILLENTKTGKSSQASIQIHK